MKKIFISAAMLAGLAFSAGAANAAPTVNYGSFTFTGNAPGLAGCYAAKNVTDDKGHTTYGSVSFDENGKVVEGTPCVWGMFPTWMRPAAFR